VEVASTKRATVGGVADQLATEKKRTQTTPKILESFIIKGPRLFDEPDRIARCRILDSSREWEKRYRSGRTRVDVQECTSAAIISTMSRRGKFITFEGLDGTGKSTQIRKLGAALRAAGNKVVETREPGGTATGEKIRRVLLDSKTEGLSPWAEMALMFASRAQHIAEVIQPALERGQIVLCDRFTDSTEAYQGGGRRLGSEAVLKLHRVLCGNVQPDLTILLDNDLAKSIGRARRRNRGVSEKAIKGAGKHIDENRFEQQDRAFFERVRDGYVGIAAREPERMVKVDASGTPGQTHRKVLEAVRRKLKV